MGWMLMAKVKRALIFWPLITVLPQTWVIKPNELKLSFSFRGKDYFIA
jgi:hypothetical protein